MDRIEFPCPACGKKLAAPANAAGKSGKCTTCGTFVRVPDRPLPSVQPAPARVVPAQPSQARAEAHPPAEGSIEPNVMTCKWCMKEMPLGAKRCPSCGKLRKDIYRDKVLCWVSCLFASVFVIHPALRSGYWLRGHSYDTELKGGVADLMVVLAVVSWSICIYYWVKTSRKLGTWWWF